MSKNASLRKAIVVLLALVVTVCFSGIAQTTSFAAKKTKKKTVKPKKITLQSQCKYSVGINGLCQIKVKSVKPQKASKTVTWKSSNAKVASVSKTGLVKGNAEGLVTITATSKANKKVKASVKLHVVPTQQGTLTTKVDLTKQNGKSAKAWVPLAKSNNDQKIQDVKIDVPEETTKTITRDSEGNKIAFLDFTNTPQDKRVATVSFYVCRKAVVPAAKGEKRNGMTQAQLKKYLGTSSLGGNLKSGIVKETSDKIVKAANAKTTVQKAKAIYNWEVANLVRIDSTIGCGRGDVEQILKDQAAGKEAGGKCTDLSSVYVSLLRAQGIPAREIFGIRIQGTDTAAARDETTAQHCRAQFYDSKLGWVEADPADVLKAVLVQKLDKKADKDTVESLKAEYWMGNNQEWVELSEGRDLTLNPAITAKVSSDPKVAQYSCLQKDGVLNNFGYPHAEVDGVDVPCYQHQAYSYSFQYDSKVVCC